MATDEGTKRKLVIRNIPPTVSEAAFRDRFELTRMPRSGGSKQQQRTLVDAPLPSVLWFHAGRLPAPSSAATTSLSAAGVIAGATSVSGVATPSWATVVVYTDEQVERVAAAFDGVALDEAHDARQCASVEYAPSQQLTLLLQKGSTNTSSGTTTGSASARYEQDPAFIDFKVHMAEAQMPTHDVTKGKEHVAEELDAWLKLQQNTNASRVNSTTPLVDAVLGSWFYNRAFPWEEEEAKQKKRGTSSAGGSGPAAELAAALLDDEDDRAAQRRRVRVRSGKVTLASRPSSKTAATSSSSPPVIDATRKLTKKDRRALRRAERSGSVPAPRSAALPKPKTKKESLSSTKKRSAAEAKRQQTAAGDEDGAMTGRRRRRDKQKERDRKKEQKKRRREEKQQRSKGPSTSSSTFSERSISSSSSVSEADRKRQRREKKHRAKAEAGTTVPAPLPAHSTTTTTTTTAAAAKLRRKEREERKAKVLVAARSGSDNKPAASGGGGGIPPPRSTTGDGSVLAPPAGGGGTGRFTVSSTRDTGRPLPKPRAQHVDPDAAVAPPRPKSGGKTMMLARRAPNA